MIYLIFLNFVAQRCILSNTISHLVLKKISESEQQMSLRNRLSGQLHLPGKIHSFSFTKHLFNTHYPKKIEPCWWMAKRGLPWSRNMIPLWALAHLTVPFHTALVLRWQITFLALHWSLCRFSLLLPPKIWWSSYTGYCLGSIWTDLCFTHASGMRSFRKCHMKKKKAPFCEPQWGDDATRIFTADQWICLITIL